jgi:CheY-like chemotaxis protein
MDDLQQPRRKARILVVGDGITKRIFCRETLEGAGFEVEEAANGMEASNG